MARQPPDCDPGVAAHQWWVPAEIGRIATTVSYAVNPYTALPALALCGKDRAMAIAVTFVLAAVLAALLVAAMMPLLRRYALARPNARSSHREPTPQGAGLAVLVAAMLAGLAGLALAGLGVPRDMAVLAGAAVLLAATGALDDLRPLGALPKLVPQVLAVGAVICWAAPPEARLFPDMPLSAERALAIVAGVWFVNLVNFMDGIDWITVTGCGVPLAALALIGVALGQGSEATPLAMAALCGALLGFAPYNRPVARVFLGDVGSLPIGLVLGFGLYRLALGGHLAAALILPLYYLYDSGTTLIRRMARREPFWRAHRGHVYQRATDAGWSVGAVVNHVLVLDLALAALAGFSVWGSDPRISAAALAVALALVVVTVRRLLAGPAAARSAR
jgi:UDP-N-acetylmuramyl pentapeptide phosphotransferase/UDP-N-acetylglucosamine-1-phosphate transferase